MRSKLILKKQTLFGGCAYVLRTLLFFRIHHINIPCSRVHLRTKTHICAATSYNFFQSTTSEPRNKKKILPLHNPTISTACECDIMYKYGECTIKFHVRPSVRNQCSRSLKNIICCLAGFCCCFSCVESTHIKLQIQPSPSTHSTHVHAQVQARPKRVAKKSVRDKCRDHARNAR